MPSKSAAQKPRPESAVRQAARTLRMAALACGEGQFLGSEEELTARLGISRPTLRQAAAQVEQEQLLSVRRGVGGGYFARRPGTRAVAHVAAIYLQTQNAQLSEIVKAVEPIRVELARLAAQNCSAEARQAMRDFLGRERARDQGPFAYRTFLKGEREFCQLLGRMSNNTVLSLFLEILYDFASLLSHDEDLYVNKPNRIHDYRLKRNRMAEAILDGDEEFAVLAAQRCTRTVTDWMTSDLKRRAGTLGDIEVAPAAFEDLRRSALGYAMRTGHPVPGLAEK